MLADIAGGDKAGPRPAANEAVQGSDLLIVVGARLDDRATGKLAEFAPEAGVIHFDIDPSEIGKLRCSFSKAGA